MVGTMCGGLSAIKDVTDDIKKICNEVKDKIEEKLERKLEVFEVHNYKEQMVAGKNYFVKIHVGDEKFIHARIYEPLFDPLEVTAVKANFTSTDEIEYFEK